MRMKQEAGFTLVELAVVVFLVGLLASVGLSALNAQMTSASISATKKKQEIIKDTLIAYLGINKRLPCPAIDNSGQESRVTTNTPANCTGYFGILPYATLGLSKSTALDGQENFFSYAVSSQWTLTYSIAAPIAGGTSTNAAGSAFNVGISGALSIKDRSPATSATTTVISSNAAAFIVSHGKNGLGALTTKGTSNVSPAPGADELANVPVSATWVAPAAFYQRGYTDVDVPTYGAFDDVALTLNPNDLITPLVKDGALKSAESQWSEQVANIKSAVIGHMFSPSNTGSCDPPTSSEFATLLTQNSIPSADPWGGSITYSRNICRLYNGGASRQYVSGTCDFTTYTISTSGFAFTITTATPSVTVNTPTINQLIASYPTPIGNCP